MGRGWMFMLRMLSRCGVKGRGGGGMKYMNDWDGGMR